jgi:hypothetical protein
MAAAMEEEATFAPASSSLSNACASIDCADEGMTEWQKALSMMRLFFSGAMFEVLCGYLDGK